MTTVKSIVQTKISFLTKHRKQTILAPIMQLAFNAKLVHTDHFDTDQLGTFDHTIARRLNPVECALKKAYLACELTGCEQGIGSEGSFNSFMGLGLIDEEFLAFVDVKRNINIIASAKQSVRLGTIEAHSVDDLAEQLSHYNDTSDITGSRNLLANHGDNNSAYSRENRLSENKAVNSNEQKWMLKQGNSWRKGLSANDMQKQYYNWPAHFEPDFRAMHCPQRRVVIAQAAYDLVNRLNSLCPQCSAPNYVAKYTPASVIYLPCELCNQATTKALPPVKACENCGYCENSEVKSLPRVSASAFYCNYCNP